MYDFTERKSAAHSAKIIKSHRIHNPCKRYITLMRIFYGPEKTEKTICGQLQKIKKLLHIPTKSINFAVANALGV